MNERPKSLLTDPQTERPGFDALDAWMNTATWLTLPRALMRGMSDDWQARMAALIAEYEAEFPNQPGDIGTLVLVVQGGEVMQPAPRWLVDWQNPDPVVLATLRLPKLHSGALDAAGQANNVAH